MDLQNLLLIFFGFAIGLLFQRHFHILDDGSHSRKMKRKREEVLSTALSSSEKSIKQNRKEKQSSKSKSLSKAASPSNGRASAAVPPAKNAVASPKGVISSSTDVSMSNVSPQNATPVVSNVSMASTQNVNTPQTEGDETKDLDAKAEMILSPRRAAFRPSQVICDCGVETMDDKEKYSEETTLPDPLHPVIFNNKTIIFPMSYERYRPSNLIHPPEGPTQIASFATKKPKIEEEATLLTPFRPVLHSLYYAHRHALLIEDLIQNYQYLED